MEFQAAVLHEVGRPLSIETIEIAEVKPTDVVVRLYASGLCHTDLEVMQGSLNYPLPIVLGHEGAGIVERVGADVTVVAPGDHVVCSWNPSCGHCFYCDRGQPILCEPFSRYQPQGRLLDGTSRLRLNGGPLHHFSMVCSHAQYCVVPQTGAVKVPDEIPFDRACLIGCGVMTGVGAALRFAKVAAGASVAVLGCGAVGLNAVQGAALARAEPVIAIDVDAAKLQMAQAFGATHAVDASDGEAVAAVRELTQGRGADYVIEAAGNEKAFQLAVEVARPGAEIVLLGKTNVDANVSFRWGTLMGEKRITRSSYGGGRPRLDFPYLAQLYLDGALKLDELITRRIRLDQINEGFADMEKSAVVRAVIEFQH